MPQEDKVAYQEWIVSLLYEAEEVVKQNVFVVKEWGTNVIL
jgi:hypothetical protein